MEYCCGGNLNQRLKYEIDLTLKYHWMGQLLEALSYLHLSNITHRDLKPENVLLGSEDCIKLGDFGISKAFLCRGLTDDDTYLSEYREEVMDKYAGTEYWVAPEVFELSYTEKADIFSLGIIFYAILTRNCFVYNGTSYYGAFVMNQGRKVGIGKAMNRQGSQIQPNFEKVDSPSEHKVIGVIKRMLGYVPETRISLDEAQLIISDAYFSEQHDSKSRKSSSVSRLLSASHTTTSSKATTCELPLKPENKWYHCCKFLSL